MIKAKQMEVRSNIKKYFDIAYEGTAVVVPRKEGKNVVIISEEEYLRLGHIDRISSYAKAYAELTTPNDLTDNSVLTDIRTENLDKLVAISTLKDNWNGNGAPAFPRSLIRKVSSILLELSIQPEIFPTAMQTIQFEYDNSRKDHLEIEVGMEDEAEYFLINSHGETLQKIPASSKSINDLVGDFYG